MPRVQHVLPHAGGGGETYLDRLAGMEGFEQRRTWLADARSPLGALPSLIRRRPDVARAVRAADLVHVHGDTASLLALGWLRERPSIITTHGLHLLRRARGPALAFVRRRLRAAVAAANRTICTSTAERDELGAVLGLVGSERLVVVPNGIPLPDVSGPAERAGSRGNLHIGEGEIAVLCLGQLEPRKDPLLAVAAVERARANGASVVLLMAGDGPLRAEVERRAGAGVRALGYRDDPEALLAAADLFVMPSRREGMSMAVLEAMGRGVPVVVSNGAGNAETVGDAGVVTPVGDVEALAGALAALAGDPAQRDELGARGRARVADELSEARMVAATRAVYERALRVPVEGAGAGRA